ncbi:MAG: ribonuclease D [Chloroflexi bacterium]|nr:ribonuclease D [Chloroflexota bacterium]
MSHPLLPPPQVIDTPQALTTMLAQLQGVQRCALDTEANSFFAYYHQVCLIQLSTEEQDYIIDPLALPDLEAFRQWIEDTDIEFTFHAAENDLLLLHRDFGFRFSKVFDTLWAARILGWQHPSLAAILAEHFQVKLDKRWQRTNWGKRPLAPEQLDYARLDTHFLLPLRDLLEKELRQHQRWEEAQDIFAELTEIRWEEKPPPTFWRIKGARDLLPREQAVLAAVFEWREAQAQRRDLPPFKVLRNEIMLQLAQIQPQNLTELFQIPGFPQRMPNSVAKRLLRAIQRGRQAAPPAPLPRVSSGTPPTEQEIHLYERLRAWRSQRAQRRGVESDVILTNQKLMILARTRPQTLKELQALQVMGPWKTKNYGPELLELLQK